jgi:uncharacterized protein
MVLYVELASRCLVVLMIFSSAAMPLCVTTKAAQAQSSPAPTTAAEPSASHLAAARRLVVSSGISRSFLEAVPQTIEHIATTFTQTRPELAHDLTAVLAQLRPEYDKQADQMIDTAAHIFAKLLNEADIKSADAFFESEAGKKYVENQPAFFNEVVNAMQDWQQKMAQDMVTHVREEMKKKGHEL